MKLFPLLLRECPEHLKSLMLMNVLSAIATASLLWLVDAAAKAAAKGEFSVRLLLMFAITVVLFAITHKYVLVTASHDAERVIHKLRVRLFEAVRQTDLLVVERIGRAALHNVLIHDTQALANILPLLAIGVQQAVMLVFLAFYLAWLSPLACFMAFGFAGLALLVRFARVKALKRLMLEAEAAETKVYDGLTDLLHGFKEVRMDCNRAAGLVGTLAEASSAARTANASSKAQWGRNFAVIEAMFYTLIGLMVFVVPLFSGEGYYAVVVPATTAALFIVGPVSTVSYVTPMWSQCERALVNIEAMDVRLRQAREDTDTVQEQRETTTESVSVPEPEPPAGTSSDESRSCVVSGLVSVAASAIQTLTLNAATFTYTDAEGLPVFSVGPLQAEFPAGTITFITGGNGSGKSTMLRVLTGLIPVAEETLRVNGQPIPRAHMQVYRDRISAIFTDYHLSRRLYGLATIAPKQVDEWLVRLEMRDKVAVRDGAFSTVALSTGQRKRLALLVAILENKPIIVLDEWAADQDPHFRKVFYDELLPELRRPERIVICVTHDNRWFHLADRRYHMNEGKMVLVANQTGHATVSG